MKDLDFDEIDRAVNSVNTSTSVQPIDSQPIVTPKQSIPLVKQRSSGQFMDVVHPSSDMRRAPLMMPERDPVQNTVTDNEPIASITSIAPQVDTPPTPTVENSSWSDPIDSHDANQDILKSDEQPISDQSEDADIDLISDDITNELIKKSDESLDSPFISGTKVEKRPLGAFSTNSTDQPIEQTDQKDSTDNDKPDKEAEPVKGDASLPDELQNDLLHIESDDHTTPETPVIDDATEVTDDAPIATSQPTEPVSIVQQYKEQPSTGDQKTGAIYDINTYHKSVIHPVKKKSGWMWVLGIVILIIVGVGAGAAVYFYVLPLL